MLSDQMATINVTQVTDRALQEKITSNIIKKWGEEMSRNFIKEENQLAKRHMKKCLTSLVIRRCKSNNNEISSHNT